MAYKKGGSSCREGARGEFLHTSSCLVVHYYVLAHSPSGEVWSVSAGNRVKLEYPAEIHYHKG